MKKDQWKWLLSAAAFLALVLLLMYRSGNIGISELAMEREVKDWKKTEYRFLGETGRSLAVFLQFNEEKTDYDICVYRKRPHSLGWFFRYGNSTASVSGPCDGLYRLNVENSEEYILYGLNTTPVEWIEIEIAPDNQRIITLVDGRPFAYVMDKAWQVTIYGPGSTVLEPTDRTL